MGMGRYIIASHQRSISTEKETEVSEAEYFLYLRMQGKRNAFQSADITTDY